MTQSITITNTSNWQGENVIISKRKPPERAEWHNIVLWPGEKYVLHAAHNSDGSGLSIPGFTLSLDRDNSVKHEAFRTQRGAQIVPIAHTQWHEVDIKESKS